MAVLKEPCIKPLVQTVEMNAKFLSSLSKANQSIAEIVIKNTRNFNS